MILENEMVIEQACTIKNTNIDNSTKIEIYREESKWWDESIPSLPYLSMVPFPNILESPILFNGKKGQINEMMKLTETFQGPQMNNIIEKATPIILL